MPLVGFVTNRSAEASVRQPVRSGRAWGVFGPRAIQNDSGPPKDLPARLR